MQIISRRARLVCATVATLTSAVLLASTVVGLTTPDTPPVVSASAAGAHVARGASAG